MGAKLREVHHLSVRVLSEGLSMLGIFPGMDATSIAHNAYRTVYPHSVGELLSQASDSRPLYTDTTHSSSLCIT